MKKIGWFSRFARYLLLAVGILVLVGAAVNLIRPHVYSIGPTGYPGVYGGDRLCIGVDYGFGANGCVLSPVKEANFLFIPLYYKKAEVAQGAPLCVSADAPDFYHICYGVVIPPFLGRWR